MPGPADTLQTCRHPQARSRLQLRVRWREQRAAADVVVPLSQDAVERAIVVAPVASGTSATEIRLPGVVEPNAYRQVVVTPLVAGA